MGQVPAAASPVRRLVRALALHRGPLADRLPDPVLVIAGFEFLPAVLTVAAPAPDLGRRRLGSMLALCLGLREGDEAHDRERQETDPLHEMPPMAEASQLSHAGTAFAAFCSILSSRGTPERFCRQKVTSG